MKYSITLSSAFLTTVLFASNAAAQLALDTTNVQTASQVDGLADTDPVDGFTPSIVDPANFINFCDGKTLANGLQEKGGSCNGIPMGDIPSQDKMVSAIIINPPEGGILPAFTPFEVVVRVNNLQAGTFVNPTTQYYAAPQQLNANGIIIGHIHVTIQDLGGSFTPDQPPKADYFEFFKGINDVGDGNGLLTAKSDLGLPIGFWRVCTINSSSNHQAVLSPVEQRGAQDDCSKFRVVAPDDPLLAGDGDAADAIADAAADDAAIEAAEQAAIADEAAAADSNAAVDPNAAVADAAAAVGGAAAAVDDVVGDATVAVDDAVGDAAAVVDGAAADAAAAADGTGANAIVDDAAAAVADAAAAVDGAVSGAAAAVDGAVGGATAAVADFTGAFGQRKKGRRGLQWRA